MTSRARTRYPGPVDFDVHNAITWQHQASGTWGPFTMTKSGALPWIDCGDGTIMRYGDYHVYPDGSIKTVKMWSPDGWDGLTYLRLSWGSCVGRLPRFPGCKNLAQLEFDNNGFNDSDWNYDNLPALQGFWPQSNTYIGGSMTNQHWGLNTALLNLNIDNGYMSGVVQDMSPCTGLLYIYLGGGNHITTGFTHGSFQVQAGLYMVGFWNHFWPASEVNAMLHDLVVSLGLGSRVTCEVQLHGGNMAAPTGQGITDKATLVSAGWTVYTE